MIRITRAEKTLLLCFLSLGLVFVYAGSFTGRPLWDDGAFIFQRYASNLEFSHRGFWAHHIWPLFDSVTFVLFRLFGTEVRWWHGCNFALHVCNTLLLYRLILRFRPTWAFCVAVLFAFHPLNTLSVAWIIQLKTLLAMTFLLLALMAWLHWENTHSKRSYGGAWLLYALSLATKSLALPVPWLALFFFWRRRWQLALIPFLIASLVSTWRIARKENVQTVIKQTSTMIEARPLNKPEPIPEVAVAVVEEAVTNTPTPAVAVEASAAPVALAEVLPENAAPPSAPVINEADLAPEPIGTAAQKVALIFHTTGRYLLFPWWPWPLLPVHGHFAGGFDPMALAGWGLALVVLLYAFKKKEYWLAVLVLAQVALVLPVSGVIALPFMGFTSISEQHLYVTLPLALMVQVFLFQRLVPQNVWPLAACWAIGIFAALTADYSQSFKTEQAFYQRILAHDPDNALATINLAGAYSAQNLQPVALRLVQIHLDKAEARPALKNDPLYPWFEKARDYYALNDLK